MNSNLKYTSLLLVLLAAFAACSDEWWDTKDPDAGKTMIELGVGGVELNPNTRATDVITDEKTGLTFHNFDADYTPVFMVMKSDKVSLGTGYTDYDYQGTDRDASRYTVTRGKISKTDGKITFTNSDGSVSYKRYWDDAHARSSALSIYAFAVPGWPTTWDGTFNTNDNAGSYNPAIWKTTEITPVINIFRVYNNGNQNKYQQTANTIIQQNLCFSNNIADYTAGGTDRRLKFQFSPTKGFQSGVMRFYHAMSKIYVHLTPGAGFDPYTTSSTFKLSSTYVTLKGFNVEGMFDISKGRFVTATDNDTYMYCPEANSSDNTKPYWNLEALVEPYIDEETGKSKLLKVSTDVAMEFTIDGNLYKITQSALVKALTDNSANNGISADATQVNIEAGKEYHFYFTVGKTEIKNITAQILPWETVEASVENLTNARVNIDIEDDRGSATGDLDLYRLAHVESTIPADANAVNAYDWTTGYATAPDATDYNDYKCKISYDSETKKWSLNQTWFWPDSKTFYHFRTIQPSETTILKDALDGDYFKLTSTTASDYDPRWGAPFKDMAESPDKVLLEYSKTTGFEKKVDVNNHQIYKAIGATTGLITLIPIHMMSQVTFNIVTSKGTGGDEVDLTSDAGTKVELLNYCSTGKVRLGNGFVDTKGIDKTADFTIPKSGDVSESDRYSAGSSYFYNVVPQSLEGVELRITTPDHNRYLVSLKDVVASTVSNNEIENPYTAVTGGYLLDYWYPDYQYTYTFKLTKKGITDLKATIVDWETVTAGDETVQIQ